MAPSARTLPAVAAASAFAALVFFFNLWSYGFWEPEEARYGEIAREMVGSGSWLIPHLNYVIYAEKPPLLYWLTAISFHLFGINEFAARFFVALFAVLGVAATAAFAGRVFGRRHALIAGAVLTTMPLYAAMAQALTTDMVLAALVTMANFAMFLQWREGGRWCWVAYVAIALGVLTKGPVAIVLPALAMLAFLLWEGDLRGAMRRFHVLSGIALVTAISAPWFLFMIARVPKFFDFYFIGEHLRRAFESSYSHDEPFYFYLPVIACGLLPWSMLVPFLTWRRLTPTPARRFCVITALTIVTVFSCASAKLIPYILPAIPPLAVLIADGLISCAWPADVSNAVPKPDSRILAESGPLLSVFGAIAIAVGAFAPNFRSPYPLRTAGAFRAWNSADTGRRDHHRNVLRTTRHRRHCGTGSDNRICLMGASWARIEAEPLRSMRSCATNLPHAPRPP